MEGGPYQEYFYIEIPVSSATSNLNTTTDGSAVSMGRHRRFVYVQEEDSNKRFPMQFGLEVSYTTIYNVTIQYHIQINYYFQVAAEIIGQPERGHWKHCLLSEDKEQQQCDELREAFHQYDFTAGAS